MHYRAISLINLPKTYDDAILAQFVLHHATDSNRTVRVEWLQCHYTCQTFKCRFAVGQLSVNCWYTAGRQLADRLLGELFFTFAHISCLRRISSQQKKTPGNKKVRVFYLVSTLKRRSLFAADWRYTYAASPHSLGLVTKIPSNDLKIHPEILQKSFNV